MVGKRNIVQKYIDNLDTCQNKFSLKNMQSKIYLCDVLLTILCSLEKSYSKYDDVNAGMIRFALIRILPPIFKLGTGRAYKGRKIIFSHKNKDVP